MARRASSFAVFIGIALSILAAVHVYIWVRLVSEPALPLALRAALTTLIAALYLNIPLTFFLSRAKDFPLRKVVTTIGFVWLGVLFILFTLLLATDAVRLVAAVLSWLSGSARVGDPEGRLTTARLFATLVALLGGGAVIAALRSGLGPVRVVEVRARLERLPKELHGTTLVQLSDIHVGSATIGRAFIERIVASVNALAPDVVAITGDLVDGPVARLRDAIAPLADLKSRYGTFFVTGNHEYYSGTEPWCSELTRLGVRVLRNERVLIGNDRSSFDLAGIDDMESRRFGGGPDLGKALEGRDPKRELVLLAHQPRAAFEADQHGVGLQLSGHTHGGQIWPWNYLVYLQQPIVAGLAKIGRTLVYVSRGTGYWGPPMRLHAPAEITRIVLESGT
ncbi:MAG TPA: metallophosphoesterase [Polyangiaceae bacterium]|jgi:hypothetical protein|nr:metallophosphoesterase [Polyangiaceae bacterium]